MRKDVGVPVEIPVGLVPVQSDLTPGLPWGTARTCLFVSKEYNKNLD